MVSRRSLLGLSIALALVMHGAFIALSPSILLYRPGPKTETLPSSFRVQLREEPAPEQSAPETDEEARGHNEFDSRPGAIEELLTQEINPTPPPESLLKKAVDVPLLSDRLAEEIPEREHHLEPEPDMLAKVDAKIIEISQETARQDIEVARRLVAPSSDRLLGGDEFPVLRGKDDIDDSTITRIDFPAWGENVLAQEPDDAPAHDFFPIDDSASEILPPIDTDVMEIARDIVATEMKKESPYQFMDDLLDVRIQTYVPPGEKKGFFRLRVSPKQGQQIEAIPKDVTFVIDSSSSISQHKLNTSAKAVRSMIDMLKPDDRFNIVVFRDSASFFRPEAVNATQQNKAAGKSFIGALESRGGTDVYQALRPVIQSPPRPGVPGIVYVISDGKPTSGVRDARTIINGLAQENTAGNSVFALSGGNTVNRYLLDLLAYRNKGEAYVAPSINAIGNDLPRMFAQNSSPLLVDLEADFGRIPEDNVFPKNIPDFYGDKGVIIYGQFDPNEQTEFAMRLTGRALDRQKEVVFKADLRKAASGDAQIARDWAFQRAYFLIGEICRLGERPELLAELRDLTRKYGIITIYNE